MSAVFHGAVIAAAVALTLPYGGHANPIVDPPPPIVKFVPMPSVPQPSAPASPTQHPRTVVSLPQLPTIAAPTIVPTTIPPIDVGPVLSPDEIRIGAPGSRVGGLSSMVGGIPTGAGEIVDARESDRPPALIGRAQEPRYPSALRAAGVDGRVLIEIVVDTLGHPEMESLQIVSSAQPLFSDAVRAAVSHYRFSSGILAGRRVRTRVQIPFDFTLTK